MLFKSKKKINFNKYKVILLSFTIAIVLFGFVIFLINSIYPKPAYNNYCNIKPLKPILNKTEIPKENHYQQQCYKEYKISENKYKLIAFIISIILGLIAISIGIILSLTSVSSGLMLGGTFLTFYGTAIYWNNLNNWLKTFTLGIVLIILIWLGYKKLEN